MLSEEGAFILLKNRELYIHICAYYIVISIFESTYKNLVIVKKIYFFSRILYASITFSKDKKYL